MCTVHPDILLPDGCMILARSTACAGEALLSKRAQKRLARTKAQAQKGRGHPVEAHISPIPESDAEGSEKSSGES